MAGKLVVIEGIDGAGTETQSKLLLSQLKEKGIPAERACFPDYDGPIGKILHEFQHGKYDFPVDIQFLLYAGDMANGSHKIRKWLAQGKVVVCDRYVTSAIAYQGLRGFPLEKALRFIELFDIPKPDYVIFLRIKPETSIERKKGEKPDSMDRNESDLQLHRDVSARYEKLIEDNVWVDWYAVDGEQSVEDIQRQILRILKL